VKHWERRDPIQRFQRFLALRGLWTPEWETDLQETYKASILEAIEIAEKSTMPGPETLFDDVFAEPPGFLLDQRTELLSHLESLKENRP
jgi:TPP-dependent pyruvate/acetoin dehydrogenase alpha subunit